MPLLTGLPAFLHAVILQCSHQINLMNSPARALGIHFVLLALITVAVHSARTAEVSPVQSWLVRPVIGPELAQQEVADYTEAHVPLMPRVRSAAQWEKEAARLRREVFDRVIFRDATSRAWRDAKTKVEWLDTIETGQSYRIRKLRYEALPGLWITALLYEPEKLLGPVPVILNVNGHDALGKAAAYKQIRCINQAKRGMIALNVEWIGMGQLHTPNFKHYFLNQLDLCGVSGIAVHFLAQQRALDILLAHPQADPNRVGVTGLSGGGWQTIFFSSLDTRVTFCNPVAGYSSFRTRARYTTDLGDSEQTPNDLATVVDYTHLTAMLAPRAALLTHNATDNCCFAAPHALPPLLQAAVPIYRLFGADQKIRHQVNYNPGTHNYERENREAMYRALGDYFFTHDPTYVWQEMDVTNEVRTAQELNVDLPADNLDFHQLALKASESLPRDKSLPESPHKLHDWQKAKRAELAALVKVPPGKVEATKLGEETKEGLTATWWALKVDDAWTVPAVELVKGKPSGTTIVVSDTGRKTMAKSVQALLEAGQRVLAIDPFYLGESKIAKRDFLYAMLLAAVGDRPLGLQASEVAGIARWADSHFKTSVAVHAVGPRSSLFSLVAAGLEEKAISRLDLHQPLNSLHDIIEKNWGVDQYPEFFCFGLLEAFDLPQLEALVAPRTVTKQ